MAKSAQLIKIQKSLHKTNEAANIPAVGANSPKRVGYDLVMDFYKKHEESGYIMEQLAGILLGVAHCNRKLAQMHLDAAKKATDPDASQDFKEIAAELENTIKGIMSTFRHQNASIL